MEVHLVVAPVFATNCCVVVSGASEAGADCVVIDAGAGVSAAVSALIKDNGWNLRAVLATHGHVDHTWDAGPLCAEFDVPFRIHELDAYRLADPFGTLAPKDAAPDLSVAVAIQQAVRALGVSASDYQAPAQVVTFSDEPYLDFGAVRLQLNHAPGHTEGSTLYISDDIGDTGAVFSGDVLFAGSIGRTDLPGGDSATMSKTLARLKTELAPKLGVIPGHGPVTTVAQELATNPYWN